MLVLLLAASLTQHTSVESRIALLEARQLLDAQALWTLRRDLPPEAARALADVELHVQHDQEQEDRVRQLTETVALLQQRLAALELTLAQPAEQARIPVMQVPPLDVRPSRKAPRRKGAKARSATP